MRDAGGGSGGGAGVLVSAAVLEDTAGALETLPGKVRGVQGRAEGLGVGHLLADIRSAGGWASGTAEDLRARAGLVRAIERGDVEVFRAFGIDPLAAAGASAPMAEQIYALESAAALAEQSGSDYSRRPNESLDDWLKRIEGQALDQLPYLDGKGRLIIEGLDWYSTYAGLLVAGGMTATAVRNLRGKSLYTAALSMAQRSGRWSDLPQSFRSGLQYFVREMTPGSARAPFTGQGFVNNQVLKSLNALENGQLDDVLARLNNQSSVARRMMSNPAVSNVLSGLRSAGPQNVARWTGNIFGRAGVYANGDEFLRGGGSLLRMAREGQSLSQIGRTAGFLRGAGVVGGVAATGYDVANLVSQGNPVEAFKRDPASYASDLAKTGFDASLLAATVAPSPVTWGAVAVTGVVWGATEVWDHWDEVNGAVSGAADWAGDQMDDLGDSIGDGIDAVKESDLNPMNWF